MTTGCRCRSEGRRRRRATGTWLAGCWGELAMQHLDIADKVAANLSRNHSSERSPFRVYAHTCTKDEIYHFLQVKRASSSKGRLPGKIWARGLKLMRLGWRQQKCLDDRGTARSVGENSWRRTDCCGGDGGGGAGVPLIITRPKQLPPEAISLHRVGCMMLLNNLCGAGKSSRRPNRSPMKLHQRRHPQQPNRRVVAKPPRSGSAKV